MIIRFELNSFITCIYMLQPKCEFGPFANGLVHLRTDQLNGIFANGPVILAQMRIVSKLIQMVSE